MASSRLTRRWEELRSTVKLQRMLLPIAPFALGIVFGIINPSFLTPYNLANVTRQSAVLAIGATGQTILIISGGTDLSQGSMIGLVSVVSAMAMISYGLVPGILIALAMAAMVGAVHGLVVAKWRVPHFVVTLGSLNVMRGLTYLITGGLPVAGVSRIPAFMWIGQGEILGFPVPALIAGMVLLAGYLFLTKTQAGRYIFAIGGNEEAAHLAGVNTGLYKTIAFMCSAVLAGVAGLVLTARVGTGQPTLGESFLLDSIAASVIGGTSMKGGEGSMVGTLLGVALIAVIGNGLNLIGVSSFVQMIVTGCIIVVAVVTDLMGKTGGD